MSEKPIEWPRITKALVAKLNDICPHKNPKIDWTDRQIWIEVGKRQMVDMIIAEHDYQQRADAKNK